MLPEEWLAENFSLFLMGLFLYLSKHAYLSCLYNLILILIGIIRFIFIIFPAEILVLFGFLIYNKQKEYEKCLIAQPLSLVSEKPSSDGDYVFLVLYKREVGLSLLFSVSFLGYCPCICTMPHLRFE